MPRGHFQRTITPLDVRFWRKVDKNGPVPAHRPELGPCWVWLGAVDDYGYGHIKLGPGEGSTRAHRVGFFLEHGHWPDPSGLHHCDNPPCVRHAHIFEGDQLANMADMVSKGRSNAGERNGQARLTARIVAAIRTSNASPDDLASRYGITRNTIYDIRRGARWKGVPCISPR